jgi:protein-tyrosine-phosphatase/diadenosine tetraphosphate (Ap4A) HIT family hydrolase
MTAPKSILFVCTGNVFRSVAAEASFKKHLSDNGIQEWNVGSAGISALPAAIDPKVLEALSELGIDASAHEQKKLTREMLDRYDIIVGMAENHIEFIKSELNYNYALLFNDLVAEEKTSIWDIEDEVLDHLTNRPAVEEKIERTVKEIYDKTPALFKHASERFYLFSDFVSGKATHRNGYPFITLHETPHSIAFMSIDVPEKENGHVLVIPKERFIDLSEIPDAILGDLLSAIKNIGDALITDHGGYNVLLNNGRDAGQYMMHTHFHIIPRKTGDDIRIEIWKHPPLSREEFIELNEKLKEKIRLNLASR